MLFQRTEDQWAWREGVRGLLAARFGRERLREGAEGSELDRGLWRELGTAGVFSPRLAGGGGRLREVAEGSELDRGLWRELGTAGFFSLRLPEEAGGVGLGLPEAVLAFE